MTGSPGSGFSTIGSLSVRMRTEKHRHLTPQEFIVRARMIDKRCALLRLPFQCGAENFDAALPFLRSHVFVVPSAWQRATLAPPSSRATPC